MATLGEQQYNRSLGRDNSRGQKQYSNSNQGNFETANTNQNPNANGGGMTFSSGGGGGSMMGGLIGGWFQNRLAKKQREHEERMAEQAYQRSLPWGSESAYGSVTFDPETKQMLQELSPEMQELMGNWLGLSKGASEQLLEMQADPDKGLKDAYGLFTDINADDYRNLRQQQQERAIATGTQGGTADYYNQLATEKSINDNNRMGLYESEGRAAARRQMLGNESSMFGQLGKDVPSVLDSQRNAGISIGQGANLNTLGSQFASRNYTDTQSNMVSQFMKDSMGRDKLYNKDGKVIQDQKDGYFSFLTGK